MFLLTWPRHLRHGHSGTEQRVAHCRVGTLWPLKIKRTTEKTQWKQRENLPNLTCSTPFRVSRVHSQSSTVLNAVYVLGKTAILFGILFLQFLAPCYLNPKSSAQDHFLRKVTTLFEAKGIETDLSNQALIKSTKVKGTGFSHKFGEDKHTSWWNSLRLLP